MCATVARSAGHILLYDVPWKAYTGLIDALPEHRIPHTYQEGTLELFKTILFDVPWQAYEKILKAFGDKRFHHTYQNGTLELMMSPSTDHERIKHFLARVIELACLELGVHFNATGSATQRDKKLQQGLEPDASFEISPRKNGKQKNDRTESKQNVRPNLAIEVDLRRPSLKRTQSYAKLGIQELWLYRKGQVEFFHLADGEYTPTKISTLFPLIGSVDLNRFIKEMQATDDYTATQAFIAWFRKQHSKK